jgi:hypothetical protein
MNSLYYMYLLSLHHLPMLLHEVRQVLKTLPEVMFLVQVEFYFHPEYFVAIIFPHEYKLNLECNAKHVIVQGRLCSAM